MCRAKSSALLAALSRWRRDNHHKKITFGQCAKGQKAENYLRDHELLEEKHQGPPATGR
jgi:hypothetical protein